MQVPTLPPIEGLSPSVAAASQQHTTATTAANESTINFDTLLAELQSYKQQNNNGMARSYNWYTTSLNMEQIMNQRENQLKQLQEYKIKNGHCNIPISDNTELGKWTSDQCKYYKLYG